VKKPFRIENEASTELQQAANWYEDHRTGLGADFLQAVDAALKLIEDWPTAGTSVRRVSPELRVRRIPIRRFPYHVVYLETSAAIRILAIAHDRRRPGYWQVRV
jgi:toxin ParE1/3/4